MTIRVIATVHGNLTTAIKVRTGLLGGPGLVTLAGAGLALLN